MVQVELIGLSRIFDKQDGKRRPPLTRGWTVEVSRDIDTETVGVSTVLRKTNF